MVLMDGVIRMNELVTLEMRGQVGLLSLNRPAQRNAISEELLEALDVALDKLPADTRAIVLHGHGPHFCAGLDLKEHHGLERTAVEFMRVCQEWHRVFDRLQYGGIPVIAALHGAALALGGAAADVDRGLPRAPLGHEADGILRQQFGDALGVGMGDAVLADDLDRAGDLGDLLGIAGRRDDDLGHGRRRLRLRLRLC